MKKQIEDILGGKEIEMIYKTNKMVEIFKEVGECQYSKLQDRVLILDKTHIFPTFFLYYYQNYILFSTFLMQSIITTIGHYEIFHTRVLGKGSYSLIYQGINTETKQKVAVKIIDHSHLNNEVTQYLYQGEIKAHRNLDCPRIIKTFNVLKRETFTYIIMEMCSRTLKEMIRGRPQGKISEGQAIQILLKIIEGESYILDQLFLHRDLKTDNILMRDNDEPVIIDFGFCERILSQKPHLRYNVGSPSYMAPEAFSHCLYSQKSQGLSRNMGSLSRQILYSVFRFRPEDRPSVLGLKYLIDKARIPMMKARLSEASQASQKNKTTVNRNVHINYAMPLIRKSNSMKNYPLLNQSDKLDKKQAYNPQIHYKAEQIIENINQRKLPPLPKRNTLPSSNGTLKPLPQLQAVFPRPIQRKSRSYQIIPSSRNIPHNPHKH